MQGDRSAADSRRRLSSPASAQRGGRRRKSLRSACASRSRGEAEAMAMTPAYLQQSQGNQRVGYVIGNDGNRMDVFVAPSPANLSGTLVSVTLKLTYYRDGPGAVGGVY